MRDVLEVRLKHPLGLHFLSQQSIAEKGACLMRETGIFEQLACSCKVCCRGFVLVQFVRTVEVLVSETPIVKGLMYRL